MKTLTCLLLTLAALISSSTAAVVVQFSSDSPPQDEALPVDPDYVSGQSVVATGIISSDSVDRLPGSFTYHGWNLNLDLTRSISFTIAPKPGHSLYLTELSFGIASDTGNHASSVFDVTSYTWAYRINNGDGYTAWHFCTPYPAAGSKGSTLTWDFDDFSTTGTVEFGLFATANSPKGNLALDSVTVAGIFAPEPASGLMIALSGNIALWRRRRSLVLNS